MARVAAGQEDAVRPLYEDTVALVYGIARRVLRDPSLAEDAVAETYLHVWRKAPQYDPERASVTGWLGMIARSRAVDLKRRRRVHRERALEDDPTTVAGESAHGDGATEAADATTVVRAAYDSERMEQIREALASLSDDQRVAVECAFFEGLTHVEVAERLDTPLGTIKTRIRTGIAHLRTRLAMIGNDFEVAATDLVPETPGGAAGEGSA